MAACWPVLAVYEDGEGEAGLSGEALLGGGVDGVQGLPVPHCNLLELQGCRPLLGSWEMK